MFKRDLFLLALLFTIAQLHANTNVINGPYLINKSNSTYTIAVDLHSDSSILSFAQGVENSTVICGNHTLSSPIPVLFWNETHNNTITNCTINGEVLSMHEAQNNLIRVNGSYALSFADNTSNIGIGYYFHLLVYAEDNNFSVARFIQIMPKSLVDADPGLVSESIRPSDARHVAEEINYTLPRFGMYYPTVATTNSSSGDSYFAVESEEVSKSGIRKFDPYTFYSPYLGYDEIAQTYFNATSGATYRPTYLQTRMITYSLLPAGTHVLLNFTIVFHNHTSYSKLRLFDGWQLDPDARLLNTYYNLTNGTYSYDAGQLSLGIHAYILLLDTPYEHENSTSLAYGVGLAFCYEGTPGIGTPGYYPLVYNSLTEANVFWPSDRSCRIGARIQADNVTIDCRGGDINSSEVGLIVSASNYTTIENCRIRGNGVQLSHAMGAKLYNNIFVANNADEYAINAAYSQISSYNNSFEGYHNPIITSNSTINNQTYASTIPYTIITTVATTTTAITVPIINSTEQVARSGYASWKSNAIAIGAELLLGVLIIYLAILARRRWLR